MEYFEDPSSDMKQTKLRRARRGDIRCGLCPYHKGENHMNRPDRKRNKVSKYRRKNV